MFLRTWLSVFLCAAACLANAIEDTHYSFVNTGIGFNHQSQKLLRFNGTSWFMNGSYKVPAQPIIFNAGYAFSRVDKNGALLNIDINGASYFTGVSLLLKPTERFHIIPSLASGRLHNVLTSETEKMTDKTNALTTSVNARYHLERNLWLNSGIIHQYYTHKNVRTEHKTSDYFTAGVEYYVDKDWGFSFNYRGNSEQFTTLMSVKFFL